MGIKYHLTNLKSEYQAIKPEIDAAVHRVLESQHFILGPEVKNFERDLAIECGVKHAIAVSSGTDALLASLMAIDVGPGDEVIVPAYSFIATASCVSRLGAIPVFVDINSMTFNIDPSLIEEAITSKTKAIIPVHFAGQPADMDKINAIAKKYALFVIEDACQAIGSEYRGRRAGSLGGMGCFSFFPTKNLGGYGDSGAITTNDDGLAERLRVIRNHGQTTKYFSDIIGGNFRMDEIQAAILSVKIKHLDEYIGSRRFNASMYYAELGGSLVNLPYEAAESLHTYHLYIISSTDRDGLARHLRKHGVETGVYYPLPLSRQECFGQRCGPRKIADMAAAWNLALPVHPSLKVEEIAEIASLIREFS